MAVSASLWWLVAPCPLALVGWDMGPFSCDAEPAGRGGLGELLRQIGKRLFQCAGINAGGSHGLIGHFPIRAADGVHALRVHVRLDAVRDAFDLSSEFVRHAAQLAQLLDLAVHFVDAHCFILLNLRVRSAAGGSEYLSHREFLSSFSVPVLTVSRWLSTFAQSLVPCCNHNIHPFCVFVH